MCRCVHISRRFEDSTIFRSGGNYLPDDTTYAVSTVFSAPLVLKRVVYAVSTVFSAPLVLKRVVCELALCYLHR
jgi:hypothetical protein